ncbi:MAG: putative ABC transporter permease [Oscillospiraceae bacterium]|nr:putative ABC transporter permease [Oscillospiraceae bacterium]
MSEPELFGIPLHMLFLYFIVYSFLGWCMETVFCSIRAKKLVPRGFLAGPLCPIYGVGVLMMICFFEPIKKWPVLFFVVAVIVMSAWEYFVSWLLEVTTHVKYWDYSKHKFNLHGRICLQISLTWGILSFAVVYLVHPLISDLVMKVPSNIRLILSAVFAAALLVDLVFTVRRLALIGKLTRELEAAGKKLEKAGERTEATVKKFGEKEEEKHTEHKEEREEMREEHREAREEKKEEKQAEKDGKLARKQAEYDALVERTEQVSRRYLRQYSNLSSRQAQEGMEDVRALHKKKNEERHREKEQKKRSRKKSS